MTRIMPEQKGNAGEKREDWLKIELFAPAEMIDALSNFMTEIGSQGAYQESLEFQSPNGFPEPSTWETLKAFLPVDVRLERRIASLQTYLDSLAVFPNWRGRPFGRIIRSRLERGVEEILQAAAGKPEYRHQTDLGRFTPTGKDIVIEIDPGMAFGTGQHPSTRMCLERRRILLRTGASEVAPGRRDRNRILGIACAKLDAERVLCVDIDKKAVEIARENVLINQVEDRVEILDRDVATLTEPFHMIVANLTAKILIRLRRHLFRLLGDGGYLVISGIVKQNKPDIEAHFLNDEFSLHRLITEKEWSCYVLKNEGRRL